MECYLFLIPIYFRFLSLGFLSSLYNRLSLKTTISFCVGLQFLSDFLGFLTSRWERAAWLRGIRFLTPSLIGPPNLAHLIAFALERLLISQFSLSTYQTSPCHLPSRLIVPFYAVPREIVLVHDKM